MPDPNAPPNAADDDRPEDRSDDAYRDDPSQLARSSDYAQGGTTGRYAGEGPGDTPAGTGALDGAHGNNAGSQEEWRGRPDDDRSSTATPPSDATPPDEIHSRSADPGQSSYGGFKDEGPGPGGDHPAAMPDSKP